MLHFEAGRLRVRDWTPADMPMLTRWLRDPRAPRDFVGSGDVRIPAALLEAGEDIRCIFEWDGAPLGYVQLRPHHDASRYGFAPGERVWHVELYIEPDHQHRGIDARVARASAAYLLVSGRATRVIADPDARNAHAVRCYERAGFARCRFVARAGESRAGDAWLMVFGLPAPRVTRLERFPAQEVQRLAQEARARGDDALSRLIADYHSGANRFARPGEGLFGVYADRTLIAIGGLSGDARIGWAHPVYVSAAHRRRGVGRALVTHIMGEAMTSFDALCLRTGTTEGVRFCEALGFEQLEHGAEATFIVRFNPI